MLYVNPGSAGPRRFKLPIAIGELCVAGGSIDARVVALDVDADRPVAATQVLASHRLVVEPR